MLQAQTWQLRLELVLRIWECTAGQIAKEVDAGILGAITTRYDTVFIAIL